MRFFLFLILPILVFSSSLQEVIDAAKPGSTLELPEGVFKGNIKIEKPITIIGKDKKSIIDGGGEGTVITIKSNHVILKNLKIIGSGARHENLDTAIAVQDSKFVEIIDNEIDDCLFGVDFQMTNNSKLVGNTIRSKPFDLGLRGDGVRLWYSNDNLVEGNSLIDSRDMVIWYSHGNLIQKNYGENCRYSLHFMYAGANTVKDNRYYHNSVGIFFMYSKDTIATGNLVQNSLGATGIGIGLKEASGFTVKNNTVIYCAQGFFIDWSPFEEDMPNLIEENKILYNSEGMHFHSISMSNIIKYNDFVGNIENIVNDTKRSDISKNGWEGNFWDDYEGFDKNKDGIGDSPYVSKHYADKMWLYNPNVKFFYGSPVIGIINFLAKLAPFSEPLYLLTDNKPRIRTGE